LKKLDRSLLWSLEKYSELRQEFRTEVMAHKVSRRISIGPHATLYFEDFLTMKYQVQEMLRAERIFEAAGIEEEISTYNPLIPDGRNLKATFMIEYGDEEERRIALAGLGGVEHLLWLSAGGSEKIFAIANEDLERSRDEKASAVHFLRFELDDDAVAAFRSAAPIRFGIDHAGLAGEVQLTAEQLESLARDLD
jgi:hypothetical protein